MTDRDSPPPQEDSEPPPLLEPKPTRPKQQEPPRPGPWASFVLRNRGIFYTLFMAWTFQLVLSFMGRASPVAVKGPSARWKPLKEDLGGIESELQAKKAKFLIKGMAEEAWKAYRTHANGFDDLQPASRSGRNWYNGGTLLITPIDALSTFHLLDMKREWNEAREMIATGSFDLPDFVSFFEVTIRNLGGLLSAYELSGRKDQLFLDKAIDLADRLLPVFDPKTGLPWRLVNLSSGERKDSSNVPMAELASFQLEFLYLSEVSGNCTYAAYAHRVNDILWRLKEFIAQSDDFLGNIFPYDMDPATLKLGGSGILSVGGGVDSFYEYILKMYVQTGRSNNQLWQFFEETMDSILKYLSVSIKFPNERVHHFFSKGQFNRQDKKIMLEGSMEHLTCFMGGTLALASEFGNFANESKRSDFFAWARKVTDTCMFGYMDSRVGLSPEIMNCTVFPIRPKTGGPGDRVYILRPETIESVFYLHRYTHEKKYRDFAWRMIQALNQFTRLQGGHGFSGIVDVHPDADHITYTNLQESFFLSETLKYLALIFSDDDVYSFDEVVLTTEAHPLAVFPDGGKCKRQGV